MSPLTESTRLTLAKQSVAPGLLDAYGGAAAAYSLRRLSANYTGPVVRVRRSSDSTEQDFTATQVSDGSLVAFVGAGNNGFVRTWYDQSGNGIHAGQTTTSLQPKIVDSSSGLITVSSKPAISIASGNTLTFTTSNLAGAYLDLTIVATITSYSGAGSIFLGSQSTSNTYWQFGTSNSFFVQGDNQGTGVAINDSTRRLLTQYSTGSQVYARYNGTEYSAARTVSSLPSGSRAYTMFIYGGGAGWNCIGNAQEFIIYTTTQSASRSGIESNINAHYAIY
jgi:hypothetical protein